LAFNTGLGAITIGSSSADMAAAGGVARSFMSQAM
jgi:hypothetical protein